MVKNFFENKLILSDKGEFCEVVKDGKDYIPIRRQNNPNFINYIDRKDLEENYYDIDLSDKFVMNIFANTVNRSLGQLSFLVELLDGDYNKLVELEEKIKNNFIHYCPSTVDKVNEILKLDNKINDYCFKQFRRKE